MKDDYLKDFMHDVWDYHNLFSQIGLVGQPLRLISDEYEKLNNYEIAYSFLPKKTLELFFYYAKNDYHIDIEYQNFIEYFIGKTRLPNDRRSFNRYYQFSFGSKKYVKKDHHKKKIKSEELQLKENWKQERKTERDKKRWRTWRYKHDSWDFRKGRILERINFREYSIDINEYDHNHDI
jgi:hypothetical protein